MDFGAISDEDEGLTAGLHDSVDWADLEAQLVRKSLLRPNQAAAAAPASAVGTKRRASVGHPLPRASPKKAHLERPEAPPAPRAKRIIKTAEAAAAVPRKAQPVPLDADGLPVLPQTCGIVTVDALGTIITDKATFHNKRYIWPLGFKSSRQYMSAVSAETSTVYHSEIKELDGVPLFEVWAEDAPEQRFQSPTSTGVWTAVFKQASALRGKEAATSASGPDFYGFSNNTIAMMIEMLPGVENCLNYQRKNFEVVPAAALGAAAKGRTKSDPNIDPSSYAPTDALDEPDVNITDGSQSAKEDKDEDKDEDSLDEAALALEHMHS